MATPRFSPALVPVPPSVPRSIGKYDIQAEIGAGTLVKVFRAFDRALGRPVTLKLLAGPADAPLKDRFRAQVALAGKLRSDSFIGIYDLAEDSGRPFATMQVMGDDDLAQAMRTRRSLSLLQRLLILWQVSEGLRAAHAGGLEHVGLRPSGIALDGSGRATVQDFGTVRLLPGPEGESTGYCAPDSECDIFSFGAIAYELLAGTYPVAEPAPLGSLVRDCPPALEQLVHRALHRAQAQRYQTIEELREDLDPILGEVKHRRCASLLSDASSMMAAGRIEQAHPLLKEVLQLEPDNRKAHRLRTELRTLQQAQASERKQRLDQQLRDAAALVGSQRYNRAIVLLCDLSREFRGDAEIARLLEQACEMRSRQEAILGAADTCDALLRDGELGKAVEFLDSALAEYPDDPVLTSRRKEVHEELRERQSRAETQKVLAEVQWVLDQDRPDLAAQLLREKTAANPRTELALRLAEIEAMLPSWEEARYVAETLPRVVSLEELEQWTVALTVLEEALQAYPASRPLLDAAERLRSRLSGEERRRKLNRRLDSIRQKMTGQAWAQALMLIEAAQAEFPDEPELERLRQSAEESRRRAEGESIVNLVRQCLEDGEPERAEELLKKGLAALPADPALLSLRQEVNAGKQYRDEWRAAQVLFGRRQFLDAEKLLARLAAQNRPEVDLLLQKVREARAATEEDNFYASGRAKAQKLIQQQNYEQAADLLRNLLSLFPGDVILQRDLQSIQTGQAAPEAAPPAREEPARIIPFKLTAAPAPLSSQWRFATAGALLFFAGVAGVWKISRSETPPPLPAAPPFVDSAVEPAPAVPVEPAPATVAQTDSPPEAVEPEPRLRRNFSPPPAAAVDAPKATLTAPPTVTGQRSAAVPSLPERAMGQTAALSPPPPPAVTPSAPPLPVGGKAEVAQLIYGPPPVIPAFARQNRIHGVIAIAATVDTQGLLKDVQVVSGNPMLAPAAREAVQRWRYRPAILNGNPVESKVDIKVSFNDR